ncbi:MAG: hypothetical protein P1V20_20935 [Verrucomicrobiales bacterium]|nr:hypothetical protein [Verrucomicrobiales bacterium]
MSEAANGFHTSRIEQKAVGLPDQGGSPKAFRERYIYLTISSEKTSFLTGDAIEPKAAGSFLTYGFGPLRSYS